MGSNEAHKMHNLYTEELIFFFGEGVGGKELLGGKGAGLNEMTSLGIPVPPGFTITTEACRRYFEVENKEEFLDSLMECVDGYMHRIEEKVGRIFGSPESPLLVSVRSGAPISMPGMMDTILNLGLNDEIVEGLAAQIGERAAYDSYRRLVQMYGNVVLGIPGERFESVLEGVKRKKGVKLDIELGVPELKELVSLYRGILKKEGRELPHEPYIQLRGAIGAVFRSWNNERAIQYRIQKGIPHDLGTAVNVQAMVYGNLGEDSCSGVLFTRNPATGEIELYGEYLPNAQGEDVVAGVRTPIPISKMKETMPDVYRQLKEIARKLEKHYQDMQDVEFTVEAGKLYILQTRTGQRTGRAAVNIALDMLREGEIDEQRCLLQVSPDLLGQLLLHEFDPEEKKEAEKEDRVVGKGLPASPGAGVGKIYFTSEDVVAHSDEGAILVRPETVADDVTGMYKARGILTAKGGMTSHAAVVARGMGKPCVAGCEDAIIDLENKTLTIGGKVLHEGDYISLDGTSGEVIAGKMRTLESEIMRVEMGELNPEESELYQKYSELMRLADEYRCLGVLTNADNPKDAKIAKLLGAEGIGLCRTEHMFFSGDRIVYMREMILAGDRKSREKALSKLLPLQRDDFVGIYEAMKTNGKVPTIIIRTLDPPLHEFLPTEEEEIRKVAKEMGVSYNTLKNRIERLAERNPMLGHRGCRLGITNPEITEMQAEAIFEAAKEMRDKGYDVTPYIMIPLVGNVKELSHQRAIVDSVAKAYKLIPGAEYKVGTMIEVPRAAITADEIAEVADFFSFGTNDLTQLGLGFSRDDAGTFLPYYVEKGIYQEDPFHSLDQNGVGKLVLTAVWKARKKNPEISIGICGQHGGEPKSIAFCHRAGLDYVSCVPFSVPTARLAAAQEALRSEYGSGLKKYLEREIKEMRRYLDA